jgi:hypothetical protein
MTGFVSMLQQKGKCQCCQGSLMDGSPLLGHQGIVDHVFHAQCLMKIIEENPHGRLRCPNCGFVSTRIDGESIPIHLKQIGKRASFQPDRLATEVALAAEELNGLKLERLLQQHSLDPKQLGAALVSAAESGDDGLIIDMILQSGPVLPVHRGKAAIAAMRCYKLNGFRRLIEEKGHMDNDSFSIAVRHAAQNNQIDFLRVLIASGQSIGEGTRGEALRLALISRSFDSVYELLPEGAQVPEISLKRLFLMATELNRQDILELFCRQPISIDIWRSAIRTAEAAGLADLARWLRTNVSC